MSRAFFFIVAQAARHQVDGGGALRRPATLSRAAPTRQAALNSFHLANRNSASSMRLFHTPTLEKRSS